MSMALPTTQTSTSNYTPLINAANQATPTLAQAANAAGQVSAQNYGLAQSQISGGTSGAANINSPYTQLGLSATQQLQNLMANPSSVTNLPGYQFGLQQQTDALQNQNTAGGMLLSGQNINGIAALTSGYASNAYQQAVNNLTQQTQIGQQSATNQANLTANAANNIANYQGQIGNTLGNADIAAGNAEAQGLYNAATAQVAQSTSGGLGHAVVGNMGVGMTDSSSASPMESAAQQNADYDTAAQNASTQGTTAGTTNTGDAGAAGGGAGGASGVGAPGTAGSSGFGSTGVTGIAPTYNNSAANAGGNMGGVSSGSTTVPSYLTQAGSNPGSGIGTATDQYGNPINSDYAVINGSQPADLSGGAMTGLQGTSANPNIDTSQQPLPGLGAAATGTAATTANPTIGQTSSDGLVFVGGPYGWVAPSTATYLQQMNQR